MKKRNPKLKHEEYLELAINQLIEVYKEGNHQSFYPLQVDRTYFRNKVEFKVFTFVYSEEHFAYVASDWNSDTLSEGMYNIKLVLDKLNNQK